MSRFKVFIALFLIIIFMMPANKAFSIESSNVISGKQNSTWLWNTNEIVTNPDKILNFLSTNNIKDLYLQINYSLKADTYKRFIKKASMKNISVHALDGSSSWVFNDGINKQKAFFDWVISYQRISASNEKFKGIHLDIEPYLTLEYKINRDKTLENYQNLLLNAVNNSKSLSLPLAIDIPFWFDGVSYTNKYGTGLVADWIIKNVKNVVIMAYRDSATGNNGIINLVSKELTLGKKYNTNVTIAVETIQSSEGKYISFYEEGHNYMKSELDKVYVQYSGNSIFNGFAIHNVSSWMVLKK